MANKKKNETKTRKFSIKTGSYTRLVYWEMILEHDLEIEYRRTSLLTSRWSLVFDVDETKVDEVCSKLLIPIDGVDFSYSE